MPIYTFYPCRADGAPTTFEAIELRDDFEAQGHVARLLRQHPTCAFVTVWSGDRTVLGPPQAAQAEAH